MSLLPEQCTGVASGRTAGLCQRGYPGFSEKTERDSGRDVYKRQDELGLKKEDYDFYLDLRKYGTTRHAGFGLGFERCVMYLTGMGNIRDVIPFPRTVKNCDL